VRKIPTLTITLTKGTLVFFVLFAILGYFVGNFLPITGRTVEVTGSSSTAPTGATAGGSTAGTTQPSRVQVSINGEPSQGSRNAKVVMIEFNDFQCPFCKRHNDATYPLIKQNYIDTGKVLLVHKDFPLPFHTEADEAAEAANCAFDQGKYWEMHDILFAKQSEWSGSANPKALFKTYAQSISGLNLNTFNNCLDSGSKQPEIRADIQEGSSVGVGGTPTFYIGSPSKGYIAVEGAQPYSVFQQVLDAELAA
jgi:protein-disulfide isomerase